MEHTLSDSTSMWEGKHLSMNALARWKNHQLTPDQVVAASQHLAGCGLCRDQLVAPPALVSLARALDHGQPEFNLVRTPELQHLGFEQMEAFVDELLSPAGRQNVERHLAICAPCSSQIADLRALQLDLRDWQAASPVSEAAVAPAVVTPQVVQEVTAQPSTFPAMRVHLPQKQVVPGENRWANMLRRVQRLLLPLEAAGVAVAAIFLLLVVPNQQEMRRISATNQEFAAKNEQAATALTKSQNQNARLETQLGQLQKRVARVDQQDTAAQQQAQRLAQSNAALESRLGDSQSQLRALQKQQRRERELLKPNRPLTASTVPQATPAVSQLTPLLAPTRQVPAPNLQVLPDGPNAFILRQKGSAVRVTNAQTLSEEAARALTAGLQTPGVVKALRVQAPASKSAEAQLRFQVLSPVGTRIRELRPWLRWKAVPGAVSYRVMLADETDTAAPLLKSGPMTQPQWQPDEPLNRGHRYTWSVQAWANDKQTGKLRLLGEAPRKPDLAATFELLSEAQEKILQTQLGMVKDSPLQKSLVLAQAGVMDEARQQFSLVMGRNSTSTCKSP